MMKPGVFMLAMCAAVLLTPGCASLRGMNSQNKISEACVATCARLKITPTKYILTVSIARQSVSLFESRRFVKRFPCSTSRFGIGEIKDSNCTPRGLHCIAEKIGGGEPAGTVFKERQIVGHTSQPEFANAKITTRILWLEGLEPGFNQGGNVDTHARYIYIHGTGDQASIGEPASHGCIHLADADLISLFDLLPVGTLVWIAER
jgi:L,D-transpeptidase YbiS